MVWTLILVPLWRSELLALLWRTLGAAAVAGVLHLLADRWGAALAERTRRALQAILVLAGIPAMLLVFYLLDTGPGRPPLWQDLGRLTSLYVLAITGVLLAGIALLLDAWHRARQLRQAQRAIDAAAIEQTQRELNAAQLRLLRGHIKPQLVLDLIGEARDHLRRGSADADAQLGRLLEYLRGALPRLEAQRSTLGAELELAGGYLSLISERSAGALSWQADIPEDILETGCPPRLLVVLVEQAVRLGIGLPDGRGHVDLWARSARDRCVLRVGDSGTLGEGRHAAIEALRRRLALTEGDSVRLQCWQRETGGSVVEVDFPCEPETG
ncbi:hypothetical protein [Pseudomarimonas salicorniae]|uniref:Histidine kinase n=1 Tax=Pseudomarimonas salicorniae TaxID=2933270 RepID=A0ABT0GJP2_9GAMM|nr:hypothetical protein [Lysobacter sp. CAU 1642]MCK7594761.1 hypothetical protein [Lysobacter sp. CAU 1642]